MKTQWLYLTPSELLERDIAGGGGGLSPPPSPEQEKVNDIASAKPAVSTGL
jgi:hypothetical protein